MKRYLAACSIGPGILGPPGNAAPLGPRGPGPPSPNTSASEKSNEGKMQNFQMLVSELNFCCMKLKEFHLNCYR